MQKSKNHLNIFNFPAKEEPRKAKKSSRQIVEDLKSRGINADISIKAE